MDNEGMLTLLRVEEYLDSMSHDAAKAMCFGGDDGSLYEWYEAGLDEVSVIADSWPLTLTEPQ